MRIWGWWRPEERASDYTNELVSLIQQRASGKTAKATATGAVETAAGVIARAFAACRVEGPPHITQALTPSLMALIGRSMVRTGEIVLAIDIGPEGLELHPASDWDVSGDFSPRTWRYRVNLSGPSLLYSRSEVPYDALLHPMYSRNPEVPWRGQSPILSAALAGKFSAETLAALADEAAGPRGYLLPVPLDTESPAMAVLRSDLKSLGGGLSPIESTADAFESGSMPPRADWKVSRIGANFPQPLVLAEQQAWREVMGACGVPSNLFDGTGEGAALRESWRLTLHGTIAPSGPHRRTGIPRETGSRNLSLFR